MINLLVNYEWLINLASLSLFTISFLIPDYNNTNRKALIGFIMIVSYSVLSISVLINSIEKGF